MKKTEEEIEREEEVERNRLEWSLLVCFAAERHLVTQSHRHVDDGMANPCWREDHATPQSGTFFSSRSTAAHALAETMHIPCMHARTHARKQAPADLTPL